MEQHKARSQQLFLPPTLLLLLERTVKNKDKFYVNYMHV